MLISSGTLNRTFCSLTRGFSKSPHNEEAVVGDCGGPLGLTLRFGCFLLKVWHRFNLSVCATIRD